MTRFPARRAAFALVVHCLLALPAAAQDLPALPPLPPMPDEGASTAARTASGSVSSKASVDAQASRVTEMPAPPQVETPVLTPMPAQDLAVGSVGNGAVPPAPTLPDLPPMPATASNSSLPAASETNARDIQQLMGGGDGGATGAAAGDAAASAAAAARNTVPENKASPSIFSNMDLPNGPGGEIETSAPRATASKKTAATPPNTSAAKADAAAELPKKAEEVKPKKAKTAKKSSAPKPPFYAFQYKSQYLPDAIYRPAYSAQNKHLPKSQTEADYDRYLFLAASQNNVNGLRALLSTQGRSTEILDPTGQTPLIVAVRYGAASAVRILLNYGANPDARDAAGVSALHYAVLTKNPDLVRALLQARADASARDPWGQTPLDLANYVRDPGMVRMLQDPQFIAGGGAMVAPRS